MLFAEWNGLSCEDKYATMGAQQRTPKFLKTPFYEPLSLNQLLDKEIKGWQDMFGQKLLVQSSQLCMQL